MFLIVTEDPAERIVTVKVHPDRGRALQRSHDSIGPARYLDKRHWLSIGAGPGVTTDLVENLVAGSYELVLDHVPRRDRPRDAQDAIDQTVPNRTHGRLGHHSRFVEVGVAVPLRERCVRHSGPLRNEA